MDNQLAGVAAEHRVWGVVPAETRQALETGLAPTDLQTMLLAVARARARAVTPARILQRRRHDRFVRPSAGDPRLLAQLEATLWQLLPERFAGVELSPVAPLGTCSAVAPVDQHRVVSTVRGTEVISDPTNALAVEAAARRREQGVDGRVDLAACHRVLRAQQFAPGYAAHFRLFALASSARDRGSGRTEAQLLIDHISVWQRVLAEMLPTAATRITVTVFGNNHVLAERFHDTIHPALSGAPAPVPLSRTAPESTGPVTTPASRSGCVPTSAARPSTSVTAADDLDGAAHQQREGALHGFLHIDRAPRHARWATQLVTPPAQRHDRTFDRAPSTLGLCPTTAAGPSRVEDVHELALAMPHVTVEHGTGDNPV